MLLCTKFSHNIKSVVLTFERAKGFAAAMSEALEKLEQVAELNKAEKEKAKNSIKEIKEIKRKLKRRKWVGSCRDIIDKEQQQEDIDAKRAAFDPSLRIKRKKCAILLGYSGADYFGMQRNPGMQTIEEELFKAMLKHKWINDESFDQAQLASFQRAARTDKGVSAARQVCSIKLPDNLDIKALNNDLPEQIRLFGVERVTKGFNAKDQCNARTYTYTMPSIAFAAYNNEPLENDAYETFRLSSEQYEKVHTVLEKFHGTRNFHNFTSRKNFYDPSSKRFIMSFNCSPPFLSTKNLEFVTLKVKGQSFMLHQIRKMVGLTIAIVRGNTGIETLDKAFSDQKIDLPMAPGLGLVLDTVHYERYNKRYGQDGIHKALTWDEQENQIQEFIEKRILSKIYETELLEKPLLDWLSTLSLHSYNVRLDNASLSVQTDKFQKDDNDE